jgi:hypothetical protein
VRKKKLQAKIKVLGEEKAFMYSDGFKEMTEFKSDIRKLRLLVAQ